jgi:hypothetical protein
MPPCTNKETDNNKEDENSRPFVDVNRVTTKVNNVFLDKLPNRRKERCKERFHDSSN